MSEFDQIIVHSENLRNASNPDEEKRIKYMDLCEKNIKKNITDITKIEWHFLNDAYTDRFFEELGLKLKGHTPFEQNLILTHELEDYFKITITVDENYNLITKYKDENTEYVLAPM